MEAGDAVTMPSDEARRFPGKVYLVGAGPGDPRLITLRGWQLLCRADVVLYDGLVNEQLLEVVPPYCVQYCVGKRGHGGLWKQGQINDLLVESARAHRVVVRLKGGDTGIFARTAEEVERLEAEGISFEIVPGITAALAVSAYTGIPITHRDWSSCLALIAGQSQATDGYADSEEPMDWKALARFPGTLILYMGIASAPQWSRQLMEAGMSAKTPVGLVRRCSWPDQQMLRCDLESLESTIQTHPQFTPPVIGVVGDVVQAASQRCWFSDQPLRGRRFFITSPLEHGRILRDMFAEQGASCTLAPVIEIADPRSWSSLDQTIDALSQIDWMVFSSVHGVRGFFQRLRARGLDARALATTRVAAVGASTANEMVPFGIQCDLVPSSGAGAEALWKELHSLVVGRRVAVVRAPEGKAYLLDRLGPVASRLFPCEAYRQEPVEVWPAKVRLSLDESPQPVMVVTSSRIAAQAVRLLGERASNFSWLSLSSQVTETLQQLGCYRVQTSAMATYLSLVETAVSSS